jgi:hypothetical protein
VQIHPETEIPAIFSSPNTNGSLFGIPRIPPKQSTHQSPSWDSTVTSPITTPNRASRPTTTSPKLRQFSSPTPLTVVTPDNGWKEEFIERMRSYESQIQFLTALVTQLLTTQQNSLSSPIKACTKRDVGIQSQPSSPCINNRLLSITKSNQHSLRSPKIEHDPPQTSVLRTSTGVDQEETMIDYSSLRKSSLISTDVNPVDILKQIFQFIDNQQQKKQQGSGSSLMAIYDSRDTTLLNTNDEEPDCQTENMFHLANTIQQQYVTSTTTTDISFISNGVQMQFINQQSSITTVYPQSQSTPLSTELLPTSPQKFENNLFY